uniref:Cytochrome P450 2G1-like n=1 Tax=Geotrypetes seraphini TaxID=260995 RepID=A0A6P8S4W6_GEOSA|nr:cytochrome P450 2G1-like [Geotrypetes seraphini]
MELAGAVILLLVLCISFLFLISAWKAMGNRGNLPPGPTPLPIVGNILQVKTGDMVNSLMKLSKTYGPVFTVYLGSRRVVVLCGYEAVKEALVDQGEAFSGRGELPTFNKVTQDFGVVFSNGERWKQLRQFSLKALRNLGMGKKSLEEHIQEEAQCLVEELRKTNELPFDPTFILCHGVCKVMCSILFGNQLNGEDKEFLGLVSMIDENFQLMSSFWGQLYDIFPNIAKHLPGPHNRIFACFEKLAEFIAKRVVLNQETLDPNNPRDFVDYFLIRMEQEKQNPLCEINIKDLVITALSVFFGGTETISTTLRYGLLILLKHPDIEGKMHEEIDHVIGQNRSPAMEDRSKMPYTDAVVHELQRFSNLLPLNICHSVIRDTHFRGYTIPKGTNVFPMLTSVLRDPTQFSKPDSFNPGHFLDENGGIKKNDAFMPFSAGKRICLGEGLARMQLFLYLTTILQNFTLKCHLDPKDIDLTPKASGFGNIPHSYQLSIVPH